VMVRQTVAQVGTGHSVVREMQYWKVCSNWVPLLLMEELKRVSMDTSSQMLHWRAAGGNDWCWKLVPPFWLRNKMTGHGMESRCTSKEEPYPRLQTKTKNEMGTVLLDAECAKWMIFYPESKLSMQFASRNFYIHYVTSARWKDTMAHDLTMYTYHRRKL
jgi:hypothetical protein